MKYGYFARTVWKAGDPLPDELPPPGTPLVGKTGPVDAPDDNPAAWKPAAKYKPKRVRARRLLAGAWYIIVVSVHGGAFITVLSMPPTSMESAPALLLGVSSATLLWIITFAVWYWDQNKES